MRINIETMCCKGATPQKEIYDGNFYIGYDTEYVEGSGLATSQFYFKGFHFEEVENLYVFYNFIAIRQVKGFGMVLI